MYNDEYNSSGWSASKIVGSSLVLIGSAVILWTVSEIFQLFTSGSAFVMMSEIVPKEIRLIQDGTSSVLFPREVLVFGIPIWAMIVTSRIGTMMIKSGLEYVELPRKSGK